MHFRGLSYLGSLAAALLAASPGLAARTVLTVDTTAQRDSADDAPTNCTLGDALVAANLDAPVDACDHPNLGTGGPIEIVLPPESGPYPLVESVPGSDGRVGLPVVRSSVTLLGHDNVVERSETSGCPAATGNEARLMEVAGGARLVVESLVLRNGCAPSSAGIHNAGQLVLRGVTLSDNVATSGNGGGLGNVGGNAELVDTLIVDNRADRDGGGIYNTGNAQLVLDGTTVARNSASNGGGIENLFSEATLMNSTVSSNQAESGGGVSNSGGAGLTLLNSTIASNAASRGPGLFNRNGSMSYANTILADRCRFERSPGNPDGGHNLERWNGCGLVAATSIVNVSTGVSRLADNTGPTPTHALRASSPGIDAGDPAVCNLAGIDGVDQRGVARPDGDATRASICDIGAVEYVDCDANGLDDGSEIGVDPGLDADRNGVLDACEERPPVAVAGRDQMLECSSVAGTAARLDGSGSSDPDGDPLAFVWTGPFGSASGEIADVVMPLGASSVSLEVTDSAGNSAADDLRVAVEDTTPPTVTAGLERVAIHGVWDDLRVHVGCSDVCDPAAAVEAVFDGIAVADGETVQVRAFEDARSAPLLTVRCLDASGNSSETTAAAPVREPVEVGKRAPRSRWERARSGWRHMPERVRQRLRSLLMRWF